MRNFFRRLFASRRKLFLIGGALLLLIVSYLSVAILMVSPAEMNLERLRRSFRDDLICHEACAAGREASISIIVKDLKENPDSSGARHLKDYFLDEKNNLAFRIRLIGIIRTAIGPDNPPGYIKDFMAGGGDSLIRAEILMAFKASALSSEDNPLDYYYKIIAGNDDLTVKLAAIRALSSLEDKSDYFDIGQLELIKKIIFDSGTDKRLRQPLVLLLGDYYRLLPDETKNILIALYKTESSGDNISRAFAADILNRLAGEELSVPEISPVEWDSYYNN